MSQTGTDSANQARVHYDRLVSELRSRDEFSLKKLYDIWCEKYEQEVLGMKHGYMNPQKLAKVVEAHVTDKGGRILDVCAGTGLGGVALKELGFTNIDAIDCSSGMLELAAQKQVYKNLFEELIGEDVIKSVEQGSYAALVTSGCFLPDHLGPMHLQPLVKALQPGGYFCMALREEFLHTDYLKDLEPTIDRMEAAGVWTKVRTGVMDHYFNDLPGRFYVYRKN